MARSGKDTDKRIKTGRGRTASQIHGRPALPCGDHRPCAIDDQKHRPAPSHHGEQPRHRLDQFAQPAHPERDQQCVRRRTDQHNSPDMFAPDALPQDKGILRTDSEDQGKACPKSNPEFHTA